MRRSFTLLRRFPGFIELGGQLLELTFTCSGRLFRRSHALFQVGGKFRALVQFGFQFPIGGLERSQLLILLSEQLVKLRGFLHAAPGELVALLEVAFKVGDTPVAVCQLRPEFCNLLFAGRDRLGVSFGLLAVFLGRRLQVAMAVFVFRQLLLELFACSLALLDFGLKVARFRHMLLQLRLQRLCLCFLLLDCGFKLLHSRVALRRCRLSLCAVSSPGREILQAGALLGHLGLKFFHFPVALGQLLFEFLQSGVPVGNLFICGCTSLFCGFHFRNLFLEFGYLAVTLCNRFLGILEFTRQLCVRRSACRAFGQGLGAGYLIVPKLRGQLLDLSIALEQLLLKIAHAAFQSFFISARIGRLSLSLGLLFLGFRFSRRLWRGGFLAARGFELLQQFRKRFQGFRRLVAAHLHRCQQFPPAFFSCDLNLDRVQQDSRQTAGFEEHCERGHFWECAMIGV